MASYKELYELKEPNSGFGERVSVGLLDVAYDVQAEDPGVTERNDWARSVFAAPEDHIQSALYAVLIANQSASVQQILDASDNDIKTALADLVDFFANAP